jgi:hypothetical protein
MIIILQGQRTVVQVVLADENTQGPYLYISFFYETKGATPTTRALNLALNLETLSPSCQERKYLTNQAHLTVDHT